MEVWERLDVWFGQTWDEIKVETVKRKAQVLLTQVEQQVLENETKEKQAAGVKGLWKLLFGKKKA